MTWTALALWATTAWAEPVAWTTEPFARDLHRRGLLLPGERRTLTPHPRAARRSAPATASTTKTTPLEDPTHA